MIGRSLFCSASSRDTHSPPQRIASSGFHARCQQQDGAVRGICAPSRQARRARSAADVPLGGARDALLPLPWLECVRRGMIFISNYIAWLCPRARLPPWDLHLGLFPSLPRRGPGVYSALGHRRRGQRGRSALGGFDDEGGIMWYVVERTLNPLRVRAE